MRALEEKPSEDAERGGCAKERSPGSPALRHLDAGRVASRTGGTGFRSFSPWSVVVCTSAEQTNADNPSSSVRAGQEGRGVDLLENSRNPKAAAPFKPEKPSLGTKTEILQAMAVNGGHSELVP